MRIVIKFEIQTHFLKVCMKITNFIYICTQGEFLILSMQVEFVIFK